MLEKMAAGAERRTLVGLNQLYTQVARPVQERWLESLRSMDDKRFFQGYAEAISSAFLAQSGWAVVDVCSPKPCVVLRHPDGREQRLVTMAFLQPPPDLHQEQALTKLARIVNRTTSDRRITILVRKWAAHNFDPEPIRRCIEVWLDSIKKGERRGRYATFEDDHVQLEFTRTDEPTQPGQGAVSFVLAPANGMHTIEVVESRLVYELDNLLQANPHGGDVLVSLVTNTGWALAPGLIRSLLYGRPVWQVTNGEPHHQRFGFKLGDSPALFQESLYNRVTAALVVDHPTDRGPCGRAYFNPWATSPLGETDLVCASFLPDESKEDLRVMRWS